MLMKNGNLITICSLMLLTACFGGGGGGSSSGGSGGSDGSGGTSNHLPSSIGSISGIFLDSAVIGFNYSTGSTNAVTGAGGSFTCTAGQDITFKLGSIVIGKSPCLPVITPIEIATQGAVRSSDVTFTGNLADQLTASQNYRLQRLSMFLQTMDADGDLSNGISPHAGSEVIVQQILTSSNSTLEEALSEGPVDSEWGDALAEFVSDSAPGHVAASALNSISHLTSTLSAQTACVIGDVSNSDSVLGFTPNCIALTCSIGYTVVDGSCVDSTAHSFASFIEYFDDFALTLWRKNADGTNVAPATHLENYMESVVGYSGQNTACNPSTTVASPNSTGQNLGGFWMITSYQVLYEDILGSSSGVKGRLSNSFLTAPGVGYEAGRRCAEEIAYAIVKRINMGSTRQARLLGLIGASDDTNFSVSADGSGLSTDELAILDLLIQHYSIQ